MRILKMSFASPVPFWQLKTIYWKRKLYSFQIFHLAVAGNLKMFHCNGSFFIVCVKISSRLKMFKSYQVTISHNCHVFLAERISVVWLDEPSVVIIFMRVSGNLLLTCTNTFWVEMEVRMEISASGFMVLQRDDGTISYFSRHAGIVKRISYQSTLETWAVETISVSTFVQNG